MTSAYAVVDVPAERAFGAMSSVVAAVQNETKTAVDRLTPTHAPAAGPGIGVRGGASPPLSSTLTSPTLPSLPVDRLAPTHAHTPGE